MIFSDTGTMAIWYNRVSSDDKIIFAGLNVKRKKQVFRILIFAFLILISFSPAYFQRDGMGNVSSVSPNMILENSEKRSPEDLTLDPPDQSKGEFSALLGHLVPVEVYPLKSVFSHLFHAPVFGPKTSILRC